MADDRSSIENTKTEPPATAIDGHDLPAGTPASDQNDALASPHPQVAETIINPATAESSQFETAKDGGGGQTGVAQSGARVVAHEAGSDTDGRD